MTRDALETLGTIIGDGETRDAVHVACLPAKAGQPLAPGAHVSYYEGEAYTNDGKPIGIVDPFLPQSVQVGQQFWILLYPRTITGLRHRWTHPDLGDHEGASAMTEGSSISIVEEYAERMDVTPTDLLGAASTYQDTGKDHCFPYDVNHGVELDERFWLAWAAVTKQAVKREGDGFYYRCSC